VGHLNSFHALPNVGTIPTYYALPLRILTLRASHNACTATIDGMGMQGSDVGTARRTARPPKSHHMSARPTAMRVMSPMRADASARQLRLGRAFSRAQPVGYRQPHKGHATAPHAPKDWQRIKRGAGSRAMSEQGRIGREGAKKMSYKVYDGCIYASSANMKGSDNGTVSCIL
jgi:hypothetical protein